MSDHEVVFVDPWVDLRGGGIDEELERDRFADELRAQVASGHELFGVPLTTVGRSFAKDDVLYQLADGRWALVHLTWQRPDRPPWPSTRLYDRAEDVEAAMAEG